jgi:hypothetical protein
LGVANINNNMLRLHSICVLVDIKMIDFYMLVSYSAMLLKIKMNMILIYAIV